MPSSGQVAGVPGGVGLLDALQVNRTKGSAIWGITAGTVTLDIASQAANSTVEQTITITGVAVGDIVIVAGPDAGLSVATLALTPAYVTGADTVKFRAVNPTASAGQDPASASFRYLWFDLTE